jgi:hypothetical protein
LLLPFLSLSVLLFGSPTQPISDSMVQSQHSPSIERTAITTTSVLEVPSCSSVTILLAVLLIVAIFLEKA